MDSTHALALSSTYLFSRMPVVVVVLNLNLVDDSLHGVGRGRELTLRVSRHCGYGAVLAGGGGCCRQDQPGNRKFK